MPERNEDLMAVRLAKLQRLRERGIDPYPAHMERTHSAAEAVAEFTKCEVAGAEPPIVTVAGRLTGRRGMGKLVFVDLRDGTGRIQASVARDVVGDEQFSLLDD